MRKAVAVPYVVALILGVAVIGLIGVWFVMSGGKFSKQVSETDCQGKLVVYCSKLRFGTATDTDWNTACNVILNIPADKLSNNAPLLVACPS